MKDITTIDASELTTKAGTRIVSLIEFGHEWLKADDYWPDRGNWLVTALIDYADGQPYMKRDLHPGDVCGPKEPVDEMSQACMEYLQENGSWNKKGVWIPNE